MTIIAYRAGMLAADSLETSGDVRTGYVPKIFRVNGGLIGFSGARPAIDAVLGWLHGGERPEGLGPDDLAALLIQPDGSAWEMTSALVPFRVPGEFAAIGGAWRLAVGAMAFGANAVEAVKVAIDLNVNCGGPIRWMTLGLCDG